MFANPENIIRQFQLGEGMKVADLGVGPGVYALLAAKAVGEDGTVYACDVQKELLTKVKNAAEHEGYDNVHVMWTDLEEERGTTLADGILDAVIATNVLFQIEHKEVFMKEIARILRPNGKVLLVDWQDSFNGMGPHVDHVFSKNAARTLAESVGLTFEQDIDAGEHHYGMIFRKKK